jgi:integrase
MRRKLTQHVVSTLTLPKDRNEEIVWDTDLEKFGLRLQRSARGVRRTYIAQYRAHGRTRREKLGSTAELALPQAREAARRTLARVALGHDPQAEKDKKRAQAVRTFAAAAELYLEAKAHLRPGTQRLNRMYLCGPYFKPLHNVPLADLSRADAAARLSAIKNEYGPGTVVAARRAVSALLTWAMAEAWVDLNVVIGTNKPPIPKARDRVLSDAELAAIWNAAGDDDSVPAGYGKIVRLSILLGSRRQEVGGMCWSELRGLGEVDCCWTLPAERSKNHHAHTIALPLAAIEIINAVPRTERDHLFGERSAGFVTWSRGKKALDLRLGDSVEPWRVHDLRRTVATRMADIGIEPHVIEAALNHHGWHRRGVAGVYNRSSYDRAVKAALQRWSAHVLALVEGRGSNIVSLSA